MRGLLAIALLLTLGADYPQHRRFMQRNLPAGGAAADPAMLYGAPFALAQQCTGAAVSGPSGALSFARASSAYCPKSDGTFVLVGSDVPRVGRFGLLVEGAGTQLLTQARDMSHADWTKASMTCTKTATGADGTASAASTCTATGANGTVDQVYTSASALFAGSLSVRRRIGTGTVKVGMDNVDGDLCDITTQLALAMANGCQWLRVIQDGSVANMADSAMLCTGGCGAMTFVQANPRLYVKVVTSGDAVDLDFAQIETLTKDPSTPMVGTSRAADVASLPASGFPTATGYWEAKYTPQWVASRIAGTYSFGIVDSCSASLSGNGIAIYTSITPTYGVRNGSGHDFVAGSAFANAQIPIGKPRLWGLDWTAAVEHLTLHGITIATNTTTINVPASHSTIRLGASGDGTVLPGDGHGWFSDIRYGAGSPPASTKIGTVGNSIMVGAYNVLVADVMQVRFGSARKYAQNFAVSGSSISDSLTQYTAGIQGKGFTWVADNAGINDLLGGSSAAVAWAAQSAILDTMISDGVNVALVNVLPCAGYSGCTAGVQAAITTYNASEAAWCSAQAAGRCVLVDDNARLRESGNANNLDPVCKATDDLHPNDACTVILGNQIADAIP